MLTSKNNNLVREEMAKQPISNLAEVANPNLEKMEVDYLYHLKIDTASTDIKQSFGDVRFCILGGCAGRMKAFAKNLFIKMKESNNNVNDDATVDLAEAGGRYCLFKVGHVLVANHGMGAGSVSIIVHELLKLLHYAKAENVKFIRMGTCGGVGVTAGTVCITDVALSPDGKSGYESYSCGKKVVHPATSDNNINQMLLATCAKFNRPARVGNTVTAPDFYESQGRLDGAFCDYTESDKLKWLNDLSMSKGVINCEMEASIFLSLCLRAKVPAAVACVALLDRLEGDQVSPEASTTTDIAIESLREMLTDLVLTG